MTVDKLTLPAKDNAVQSKVNEIVDELGNKLENTSNQNYSLTIEGTANTQYGFAVNIGKGSAANGLYVTAIGAQANGLEGAVAVGLNAHSGNYDSVLGYRAGATGSYSVAIGANANVSYVSGMGNPDYAIQLGYGTNSTAKTLAVGFGLDSNNNEIEYELLNGTTGFIPDARISTNIARTSQIPTVPTNISSFTNDSGYITEITSSDVTTALGYTPYDSSNPSGYTSNVGTVTSVNNTSPDANGNVTISIPSISNLADKDLGNLSATGQAVIDGKADTSFSNITNTAKIAIAHNAMPSNTYTDLTLGASGATYTAPTDGYYVVSINMTGVYSSMFLLVNGSYRYSTYCAGALTIGNTVPVKKGDVLTVNYFVESGTPTKNEFRFYYAVGSESEVS